MAHGYRRDWRIKEVADINGGRRASNVAGEREYVARDAYVKSSLYRAIRAI